MNDEYIKNLYTHVIRIHLRDLVAFGSLAYLFACRGEALAWSSALMAFFVVENIFMRWILCKPEE